MSDTDDDLYERDDLLLSDDTPFPDVIRRAHRRFKRAEAWEAKARQRWLADYKFANGDDENHYQWPDIFWNERDGLGRPALTFNKTRQHNLLIINDAKQNKQGIKFRPVSGGATREAADVYEGIARHVQDISRFQDLAGTAIEFQVEAGLGYTRVVTDYVSDDSFDQEIFFRGVPDPLSCYLDPDHIEKDGSDARYGYLFADRPREEMVEKYPWLKGHAPPQNAIDGGDGGSWIREDHIREAEYYEVTEEQDELLADPVSGTTILRSEMTRPMVKKWVEELLAVGEKLKRRKVMKRSVHWYKIVGDRVVDDAPWAGTTVPIIPWIGQETVIENQLDRKGHTRYLKSANQMLNYNRSASIEFGALQSKTPYVGPMAAFEGYETYWSSANTVNHAWLPYNHIDDNGNPIPKPERQQPPTSAPVFIEGAQAAEQDMMSASGQYQAELGAPGNEISGKAIDSRQRQGDRATYHFTDNQAIAIRRHGAILLELIPKIYDTEGRVIRILGEDREESHVTINPQMQEAQTQNGRQLVFNPNVGKYEVVSDVGPDYATQRQEAYNAIVQILTQAPQLIDRIGDLLFKVADFPLADEIAERLKPGMPMEAQAAISGLQRQLQQSNQHLGEAMQSLAEERLKNKAKDAQSNIDVFEADTKRLAVIKDMLPLDPMDMQRMIHETVRQALQDNLGPVLGATAGSLEMSAAGVPPPGASPHLPLDTPNVGEQQAMIGGA